MADTFQKSDGMNYAPKGKPNPVCAYGDFKFAAVGLDHGHIFGMCNGLLEAGAALVKVFDPDNQKVAAFLQQFPHAQTAASYEEILKDQEIRLIASAAIPKDRCNIGIRAMQAGKDFFGDKPPVITLDQLELARQTVAETGRKFLVYFSERLHVEASVFAEQLIKQGAIGQVVHIDGFGPHRLSAASRPAWFFDKDCYGGIICDIGCHQIEQFLFYGGAKAAAIDFSRVANYSQKQHPHFEDFGDIYLTADNGVTGYLRIDWFTPEKMPVWGDGRTFITGTKGTIELRKYIDVCHSRAGNHVYLCNEEVCEHYELDSKVGFPFFGAMILDCLNRTETAITQSHIFRTLELSIKAQQAAKVIR